ncbi:hypothetical protein RFI_15687 [Reticulomyxa filosa]|uniref:Uncharacterized protein n=1 Tax=Reticulomyxa filosa TaxID=46433 RepID=X6N667_RETFI|nr:hypothetical protein RFI_15687 [Reticulomyxa filosa]|eukprot:ETO21516.1 hypothetical protein RFI_15687 [Reticulomyxa filosa]
MYWRNTKSETLDVNFELWSHIAYTKYAFQQICFLILKLSFKKQNKNSFEVCEQESIQSRSFRFVVFFSHSCKLCLGICNSFLVVVFFVFFLFFLFTLDFNNFFIQFSETLFFSQQTKIESAVDCHLALFSVFVWRSCIIRGHKKIVVEFQFLDFLQKKYVLQNKKGQELGEGFHNKKKKLKKKGMSISQLHSKELAIYLSTETNSWSAKRLLTYLESEKLAHGSQLSEIRMSEDQQRSTIKFRSESEYGAFVLKYMRWKESQMSEKKVQDTIIGVENLDKVMEEIQRNFSVINMCVEKRSEEPIPKRRIQSIPTSPTVLSRYSGVCYIEYTNKKKHINQKKLLELHIPVEPYVFDQKEIPYVFVISIVEEDVGRITTSENDENTTREKVDK